MSEGLPEELKVGDIARACCDYQKVILKGAMTGKKLTNYNTRRKTIEKYYDLPSPGFYAAMYQVDEGLAQAVVVIWVSGK